MRISLFALIGVVAFIANQHSPAAVWPAIITAADETKFCGSWFVESVAICRFAENEKSLLNMYRLQQERIMRHTTWTKCGMARIFWLDSKYKINSFSRFKYFSIGDQPKIVSWSQPRVTDYYCDFYLCSRWVARFQIYNGFSKNIGPQLPSSGVSANNYLAQSETSQQKSGPYKPPRERGKVSSVFGYQAIIFVLLVVGFVFQIVGFLILEDGDIFSGAFLAGGGFLLSLYSGLAAVCDWGTEHLLW